jgi:hypothetical protein
MTEREWLRCDDPANMLSAGTEFDRPRRWRLLALICGERVKPLLYAGSCKTAIDALPKFVDGLISSDDLRIAHNAANAEYASLIDDACEQRAFYIQASAVKAVVLATSPELTLRNLQRILGLQRDAIAYASDRDGIPVRASESKSQIAWIRDIFGNPFRPVAFDPRWRTEDVLGLARGIYEERAFDRLPLLADAVMDAGCADEQVLEHCRSDGPHVRGCWVVDLVLGKE